MEEGMKAGKRFCSIIVLGLVWMTGLFAAEEAPQQNVVSEVASQATETVSSRSQDDLLLSGVPLSYGDEKFRERILERTGGKRSPIGLVLSGGSARAMAHIGVLKYLEEQGIVPDYIISNSMGSIVGLLYAAGMSPDQIERCIEGISLSKSIDFTLPLEGGLLKANTLASYAVSLLGDRGSGKLKLEDLDIPIIVVEEDLVTKRQILVSEGDFASVFRASFAIPVYFPSVEYKGHLLIDGGINNLAPINLAYQYSDDVIVSTTFNTLDDLNLRNPFTALNTMLDIQKRRTGVSEIVAHPDMVWVRCDVEKVSFMDFADFGPIVKKGYDAAKAQKDALAALPPSLGVSSMENRRSVLEKSIDKGMENFAIYNHVRQTNNTNTFSFEFNSYLPDEASYLKDSGELGLAYQLKWGDFSFYLLGGSSLTTYRDKAFSASPVITSSISYYAWHHTRLSFLFDADLDQGTAKPSLYLRANLESRYLWFSNHLLFKVLGSGEFLRSSAVRKTFTGTTTMVNGGLSLTYQGTSSVGLWNVSGSNLSVFVQGYGNDGAFRPFLAIRGKFAAKTQPHDIFMNLSTTLRFAMDGEGNVPLFAKDGFRTNSFVVQSEGHDQTVSSNSSNMLLCANLTLGWQPSKFKPSLAEMMIFKDTSIAAFFDFLWINEPYYTTGMELTINPSFLGLKDFPLTVFWGYDSATEGAIWGFWLSTML